MAADHQLTGDRDRVVITSRFPVPVQTPGLNVVAIERIEHEHGVRC